jgi:hypothetical protein
MIVKGKAAGWLAALAGVLLFAGNAQANLLTNANFDAQDASGGDIFGALGWDALGGTHFTTAATANSPDNSLKVFGDGGASQSFAATAGQTWVGNAVGQNWSGDPILNVSSMLIQIAFFDADGNPAGTAAGGNVAPGFNIFDSETRVDANTTQDVWTSLGVGTAPAPDNTAEVQFIVLGLMSSGGAGFFDDASFDQVVIPVPAAVWLFGSALGLLGWVRRKAA